MNKNDNYGDTHKSKYILVLELKYLIENASYQFKSKIILHQQKRVQNRKTLCGHVASMTKHQSSQNSVIFLLKNVFIYLRIYFLSTCFLSTMLSNC